MTDRMLPHEREAIARMIADAPEEENAAMLETLEKLSGQPTTVQTFLVALFTRLGNSDPEAAATAMIAAGPLDFRAKLN